MHSSLLAFFQLSIVVAIRVGLLEDAKGLNDFLLAFGIGGHPRGWQRRSSCHSAGAWRSCDVTALHPAWFAAGPSGPQFQV